MKTLSASILILALAIGYTGYSFSHRPIQQSVVAPEPVEVVTESLAELTDEQIEEYMEAQEGLWYGIDDVLIEPGEVTSDFVTQGI